LSEPPAKPRLSIGRPKPPEPRPWPEPFDGDITHFASPPTAWGVQQGSGCPLATLINAEAYRHVREHALATPEIEVFGLLVGEFFEDPQGRRFVLAERTLAAEGARAERASVQVDHEGWIGLMDRRDKECPSLRVVGWYHSHPGWGIFFSGADKQTHRFVFFAPHHVGLVFDPTSGEAGVFQWAGQPSQGESAISGRCGFYLYEAKPELLNLLDLPPSPISQGDVSAEANTIRTDDGRQWHYRCPDPGEA
jgi:proteasome lid subunit RPN8/RPN11